jgi:hypothetical protein
MIKMSGTKNGRKFLVFGLSDGNLLRLTGGSPILVDLAEMGIDAELLIFHGKTEAEMEAMIREAGLIGAETIVHVDPKLAR